jgi:hypothetical protein
VLPYADEMADQGNGCQGDGGRRPGQPRDISANTLMVKDSHGGGYASVAPCQGISLSVLEPEKDSTPRSTAGEEADEAEQDMQGEGLDRQ